MPELQNKDKPTQLSSNLFPVVGVGASAGGLDAFKRLLKFIPENSGMAYILVQHLEPTHESILVNILQKVTSIPIQEITNNVRVEPNHIYIIPSNRLLTANDGVLHLNPRLPKNEKNMPIDVFFTSLAEVHQSHAIGVVLSGTATDGTLGLKAIKEHGGITFAQEQQSAAFDGMPQSAIDAEVVDFILTPEEIAHQLVKLNLAFKNDPGLDKEDLQHSREDDFRHLLSLLRLRKGADFTYYKQTTIRRRIIRRIGLNKIENISDYLAFFRDNASEQEALYHDLLIPVTSFFRDPKTYDILCETLFPLLLKDREEVNPLRFWVAGCSTGEEAYSMAMCLYEYLGIKATNFKIQIFATDISEKSIVKARTGLYSNREIAGVSVERLEKYFSKINDGFQINKIIRDMCVFACHNFLKDPPFAKMDFISCRNVLIYMEPFLQKRALTTFHYALKESGYLLLGKSETTGPASDLFSAFANKFKLYSRKPVPGRFLHVVADRNEKMLKDNGSSPGKITNRDDFQKSADDILLSKYTPSGVVVNDQMDIVQFRGSTGTWLEPSPGKPNLNVLKMAREGLAFELRSALHKVKTTGSLFAKENIPIQVMGRQQFVNIEVIPLPNTTEPHFLILFKDTSLASSTTDGHSKGGPVSSGEAKESFDQVRIRRLNNELAQAREDMRSITEEQEAANEELQSANEELLSGSEELQSLNEELETSKEEIQSTNEELTTLNQELFDRNEQLNQSRIYAESIIATIREPLVVLDKDMRVKTANRSYYDKFKTTEEDTEGKVFFELGNKLWDIPALRLMLQKIVLEGKTITGFEIRQTSDQIGGRTMLLNANRIQRKDNAEQLILLAIEDVTEKKLLENEVRLFTRELERQVEERTVSLKEANVSLLHSNENLQQFAIIASHDLQEPLRKIRTFANILNQRYSKNIEGEARELLNKIGISAERMSSLINDVLNYSKLLDSKGAFEKTDLNEIIRNVLGDFDLQIAQKNAIINNKPLPVIQAIPLQIHQLFGNLLGNAIKFSKPDVSPIIDIQSRSLAPTEIKKHPGLNDNLSYCEISFSDNGIGFDQQFAKQMFLVFQRLNSREKFGGTGVGLAICKKIVANHQGEIFAEAREGKGASFHIILPMERESQSD